MSDEQIREVVLGILGRLAPEMDVHALKADVRLRDQIDIDSMDFLNFLIAVDAELGVDIPEADYPKLASLNSIYAYLRERIPTQP
jgi:acyl carrier protein